MRLCVSLALSMGFVYNKENTIILCNYFSKEISECEGVYCQGWMNVFPNKTPTLMCLTNLKKPVKLSRLPPSPPP